jgi:predicted amidohydrolase
VNDMQLVLVQPHLSMQSDANNLATLSALLEPQRGALTPDDLVLLPEHWDLRTSRADYETAVVEFAKRLGCHVVGGSHHEQRGEQRINSGIVADARGQIIASYEKLRPYADERSGVAPGTNFGEFSVGGRRVLVLICADFWFSDVFYRASAVPDLILVPALSVSRKPSPDYSRALWQHLAVARAYEFGVYVGISDWAHARQPGRLAASGVSGFADPTTADPNALFRPVTDSAQRYELDFTELALFRRDRQVRGFFWRPAPVTPSSR